MSKRLVLSITLAGCGGPVLGNVPHPNNAAAAGIAAGAAAAMTLADPNGNTFKRESNRTADEQREVDNHATVPPDVLDRLDDRDPKSPPAKPRAAPPKPPASDGEPLPAGPDDHPNPLAPRP